MFFEFIAKHNPESESRLKQLPGNATQMSLDRQNQVLGACRHFVVREENGRTAHKYLYAMQHWADEYTV